MSRRGEFPTRDQEMEEILKEADREERRRKRGEFKGGSLDLMAEDQKENHRREAGIWQQDPNRRFMLVEKIPAESRDPAEGFEARQQERKEEEELRQLIEERNRKRRELEESEKLFNLTEKGAKQEVNTVEEKKIEYEEIVKGIEKEDKRLSKEERDRLGKVGKFRDISLGRKRKPGKSQGKPGTGERPEKKPRYKTELTRMRPPLQEREKRLAA